MLALFGAVVGFWVRLPQQINTVAAVSGLCNGFLV